MTNTLSTAKTAIAVAGLGLVALSGVSASAQDATQNIVEIASGTEELSTLVAAVTAADLAGAFAGDTELTVLAPTNDAFAALPDGVLDNLLLPENKQVLVDILNYHVIEGALDSTEVSAAAGSEVATLNGDTVSITEMDGTLMVDAATVTTADIDATNGVVHLIDSVLVPAGVDVSTLATPMMDEMEDMDSDDMMDTTVRTGGYSAPDYTGYYTLAAGSALIAAGAALRLKKD